MRLFVCSDQDLAGRYPPEYIHTVSTEQVARDDSVFLLARVRGVAVGCAAVVPLDKEIAEVKRMFVEAGYRGHGIGRTLLEQLEISAATLGYLTLRLETGDRQPEAGALYQAQGCCAIERYGEYVADPHSLCFEKFLVTEAQ